LIKQNFSQQNFLDHRISKYQTLALVLHGNVLRWDCKRVASNQTRQWTIITHWRETFSATLADNSTSSAFMALLPLSVKMRDLHGNEKFFHLPSRLPSNDPNPGTIQTGDLMLWSSKTVVIFYKTSPTSDSYTKLGRIDDPEGLSAAVGSGNVSIKFELE
jgi:hypothetical protein